jgi:hypothetical protein
MNEKEVTFMLADAIDQDREYKSWHVSTKHLMTFAKMIKEKESEANKQMLHHKLVLVQQTMERVIQGCQNVKEEEGLHKDAKSLAKLVIKECNTLLKFVKEQP